MTYFGDWRDTRSAINHACDVMGEPKPDNIPQRDWKLVDEALKHQRKALQRTCVECRQEIGFRCEIVCLDCKGALHETCASRHFWPNGRPRATGHDPQPARGEEGR